MIGTQAGYIDIFKAVVVVIAGGYAHSPTDIADAGLISHIFKGAVAIVVVKSDLRLLLPLYHVD